MSNELLDLIAALSTDDRPPQFAAIGELPGAALRVQVAGFGPLVNPLAIEQASELARAGAPAAFGHREKTLVDSHVRNSQEIPGDKLNLTWEPGVEAELLQAIAQSFGLPGLEARAHGLSIYGPGGFFKTHQDTEKHAGMVATLVVIWPSAHIGGELRIQHGKSAQRFASEQLTRTGPKQSASKLLWCAFFADCLHEVLPVSDGYRLALTFDLLVSEHLAEPCPTANAKIVKALASYFAGDLSLERSQATSGESNPVGPLLIALEHQYSEHGLVWAHLKAIDRLRVGQLLAAVDQLGLIAHLALAEIEQTWTATADNQPQYRRWGTHDDSDGNDGDELDKGDLIDSSLTLDYWVDRQGQSSRGNLVLYSDQVICVSETDERYLTDSEYEGYMGNYGETLQYWYRRAVLVVQSPLGHLRTRFKTNFESALNDLLHLAQQNDASAKEQLHVQFAVAQPLLIRHAEASQRQRRNQDQPNASPQPSLFSQYAQLALALGKSELALSLLQVFASNSLTQYDAKSLAHLESAFGAEHMLALLANWLNRKEPIYCAQDIWSLSLTSFVHACGKAGVSAAWQSQFLQDLLVKLYRLDEHRARKSPRMRQADFAEHLLAISELAQAMTAQGQLGSKVNAALLHDLLCHLLAKYPKTALVPIAKVCLSAGQSAQHFPIARSFALAITLALESALATPARTADDFALREISWTCACADCLPVRQWAESPTNAASQFALAEARRTHIVTMLQDSASGVSGEVIKQGSPYKLRLQKPKNLHITETTQRAQWQVDLADLQRDLRSSIG